MAEEENKREKEDNKNKREKEDNKNKREKEDNKNNDENKIPELSKPKTKYDWECYKDTGSCMLIS